MGGIHIHMAYQNGAWACPTNIVSFLQVMDSSSGPQREEERPTPVRMRGAEHGGGAPGPSTVKGERNG